MFYIYQLTFGLLTYFVVEDVEGGEPGVNVITLSHTFTEPSISFEIGLIPSIKDDTT